MMMNYKVFVVILVLCCSGTSYAMNGLHFLRIVALGRSSSMKAVMVSPKRELWKGNIKTVALKEQKCPLFLVIETPNDRGNACGRVEKEKAKIQQRLQANYDQIDLLTQKQGALCAQYAQLCRQSTKLHEKNRREENELENKKQLSGAAWFLNLDAEQRAAHAFDK